MLKVILSGILLSAALSLNAQSTIVSIPSSDAASMGSIYVRSDNTYNPKFHNYSSTPNFMFGIGKGSELDLNFNTLSYPFIQTLAIESGFKTAGQLISRPTPDGKFNNGLILYGGAKFVNAIRNSPTDFSEFTYTATSLIYYRNRFTSGAWDSQNYTDKSNRSGAMVGYEFTFNPNVIGAIDWSTGHGTNGYTSFAFEFLKGRWMIQPGYQLGNIGVHQGNHQALLSIQFKIK